MKKIIIILFGVIGFLSSCTDDITSLNEDTKNPTVVPAAYLFSNAQKTMVDQMHSTNVNANVFRLFVQQFTETVYLDESNYDLTTRSIPDTHFRTIYRDVLKDLVEAKLILDKEIAVSTAQINTLNNKKAQIEVMIVYCYYVLVDTFGDVPYSEALNIEKFPNPKYDKGLVIYKDLISRLNMAATSITTTSPSFGSADLIYAGNMSKWLKLTNSLKLKMGLNLYDTDPTYASTQILSAVSSGVLNSNADNASIKYLGVQPNTNPLYVDVVASGRDDFVPTSTIVNQMNLLNDPRRSEFFTKVGGIYEGGTPGMGNTFANFSHIGSKLLDPTFEGLIFDYSEVEFLLAEAVERGVSVGGTAESHYNNAITASMQYWNVSNADIATYLAQTTVAYSTAAGNWKRKIGEQSYLGLYNRGFEAWTSYRRLDFPTLVAPPDAAINEVPKRYTYPALEQTLNSANNKAASISIGGDLMTTKIFWDVN